MGSLSLPLPFPHELVEGLWAQEDVAGSLWNTGWANRTRPVSGGPVADLQGPEASRVADLSFL